MHRLVILLLLSLLALLPARLATAGLLDALVRTGSKAGKLGAGAGGLEAAVTHIRALPIRADRVGIAATGTHEGHWRLVNRAGETMTAATHDELIRALGVLAPEAGGIAAGGSGKSKLALYLSEDTVFLHRQMLKELPKVADLNVVVGGETYRLIAQGEGTALRLHAEVRPRLVVELVERRLFDEAIWQLARPLNKANIRVVALEPGAPTGLTSAPRIDPATKRAATDLVDPDRLRHSMSAVRGQTVLVTGRVERGLLYYQPASGPERSLILKDLVTAAEAADVNLVVLRSSSPRQPGVRNWLWQKAEVANLDAALQHAALSDFLNALTGDAGRMIVSASEARAVRTTLDIGPVSRLGAGSNIPLTSAFNDIVAEVTAKVVIHGSHAFMRSAEREQELEQRLIPGVPTEVQNLYIGSLIMGFLGWSVARRWWQRLWPHEDAAQYGGALCYRAARITRGVAFVLLFLPVVGVPCLMVHISQQMFIWLTWPFRWLAARRRAA